MASDQTLDELKKAIHQVQTSGLSPPRIFETRARDSPRFLDSIVIINYARDMKKLAGFLFIFIAFTVLFALSTEAAVRVRGYYRPSTGSYVPPSYRSSPNSSRFDNWSTRGNVNPYTGRAGTQSPFRFR